MLVVCGAVVALLLLVRGIGLQVLLLSGALDGNSAISPARRHWALVLWNPWFVVGGAAFGAAAVGATRTEDSR